MIPTARPTPSRVHVPRDGGALLGFTDGPRWRLVRGQRREAARRRSRRRDALPHQPPADTPLGVLFAPHDRSRWSNAPVRVLLAALLGLLVLGVTAYAAVGVVSRRFG